nr:uncharacterized protein LOC118879674 isoform X2 [Drosophila suzukii]
MVGKPQKRLQDVTTDEIRRIIQAVAHYCETSPTGTNTTTGQIRRINEVLERSTRALGSLHGHSAGSVLANSWCKGFLGFLEKYFVFMVQRIFWDFWKNNY